MFSKHQHRFARREASVLIAVAILCARELSIRQHIMLFTVLVIELYIVHASFRVDGESITVLTYYVNRLFEIFTKFPKRLISLSLRGVILLLMEILSNSVEKALVKISVLHHICIYEKCCKKRPVFYTKVTIYKSGVKFFPGYPKKQRRSKSV